MTSAPDEIPRRIAMALSGGGSRAAVFHFGTLDYLDRVGLLPRVAMISTVSGGSFTGAKYALCMSEPGYDYNRFFGDYYSDLYNTKAVAGAFKRLGRQGLARGDYRVRSGRRGLITAAADVYAETFLASKLTGEPWTLGQLLDAQDANPDYPLDVVVLNTTEYSRGLAFRFGGRRGGKRVSLNDGFVEFGNAFVLESVDDKPGELYREHLSEAKAIRIADIVAASSCLPGLFEPILFPDDFGWPGGVVPPHLAKTFGAEEAAPAASAPAGEGAAGPGPMPLMDGGIYDNQGIESLMLADQDTNLRRLAERLRSNVVDDIPTVGTAELPSPPDLFIVSDADRREESIYPVGKNRPDARKRPGSRDASEPRRARLPLWGLIGAVLLLSGISLAAGFIAVSRLLDDQVMAQASPSDMLLYASALLFAFPIAGGLLWAVMRLKQTISAIPQARADAWRAFLAVHIDPLLQTLKARWRSAVATFQGVMPLRTRNLGYWIFYSDPRYEGRRLSNRIYDLQTDTCNGAGQGQWEPKTRQTFEQLGLAPPSAQLSCCIDKAATMDTAFWFEEAEWQIPVLLVCGQATICFNLMKHLRRQHGNDPARYPPKARELWGRLQDDWARLQQDPYALLKQRIEEPAARPKDGHGEPLPMDYPPGYPAAGVD
ncbi:MAG: patatin-like phospholipase family protein [Thiohalocapsa sp.]